MTRITQWGLKNIRQLFDFVFEKVDFYSYHDNQSYIIEKFFKKFNAAISDERVARLVFDYFVKLVTKITSKKTYVLFIDIRDLDNIYKNHQDYGTSRYFSVLPQLC